MSRRLEVIRLPNPDDAEQPVGLLRPKRTLSPAETWILAVLAILPLLSIAIRLLALPGVIDADLGVVGAIGDVLNRTFSLAEVPPDQRDHVLYLLFVPTCAMLVALVRLTLGLRVLGFRSILIAVAFQQSGIPASLLLIAISVATILTLRPWLRRIRLPYYARVSVILSVVSVTMVGALLLGPLVRSDIAWGMAYFPVIVLGMLAEGIARTADRDNPLRATGLAINTLALAFVMALICWIPPLRAFLLRFPEIAVTQIVAIVMISEFFDLRWFQQWDQKLVEALGIRRRAPRGPFRVAVVRNRVDPTAPSRPHQALRSVQKIVDALRASRYSVRVIEGDATLLRELRRFLPEDPATGERRGIVFNLAHGSRGDARTTHVPAMLEMSGFAYSGPTPLGNAMMFDRVVAKVLMQQATIPTPAFRLLASSREDVAGLRYPVIARPRHEPAAKPIIATDRRQLRRAVKRLGRRHRQDVFVEEHVTGRLIGVGLLGNDPIECLPLVEVNPRGEKICPAPLDEPVAERVREFARAAFRACGCRDYARVDIRIGETGDLWVLDVRTLGILAGSGAFVRAGAQAGYTFEDLLRRIVELTRKRSARVRPISSTRAVVGERAASRAGSPPRSGSPG